MRVLRLRLELLSAKILVWIATVGREVELDPETHLYLADVHFRLADAYAAARKLKASRRHRDLANQHAAAGPSTPLPPAAAMAMPVPQPYFFTDARGPIVEVEDPDEPA